MDKPNDGELIALAYAATFALMMDKIGSRMSDDGDTAPVDIEKEYYRLVTLYGLQPPERAADAAAIQAALRRQLPRDQDREIFDLGCQLVKQHAVVSFLQCYPKSPLLAQFCLMLEQMVQAFTRRFKIYGLARSVAKLPVLPLPGVPEDAWMNWSGDELRESVIEELNDPVR